MTSPSLLVDISQYEYYRLRSAKKVYRVHGINRKELEFLLLVSAFMAENEREIAGFEAIIKSYTARPSEKFMLRKYGYYCLQKGWLGSYEYVYKPGSLSIGLTDTGATIIQAYYDELAKVIPVNISFPIRVVRELSKCYVLKPAA